MCGEAGWPLNLGNRQPVGEAVAVGLGEAGADDDGALGEGVDAAGDDAVGLVPGAVGEPATDGDGPVEGPADGPVDAEPEAVGEAVAAGLAKVPGSSVAMIALICCT